MIPRARYIMLNLYHILVDGLFDTVPVVLSFMALAYGSGVCTIVGQGKSYPQLITETMSDFDTTDEYQAVYLINQAANESCPELIWQLRQSAAHYVGQPTH